MTLLEALKKYDKVWSPSIDSNYRFAYKNDKGQVMIQTKKWRIFLPKDCLNLTDWQEWKDEQRL